MDGEQRKGDIHGPLLDVLCYFGVKFWEGVCEQTVIKIFKNM